jgi:hypothetical protein
MKINLEFNSMDEMDSYACRILDLPYHEIVNGKGLVYHHGRKRIGLHLTHEEMDELYEKFFNNFHSKGLTKQKIIGFGHTVLATSMEKASNLKRIKND